MRSLQLYMTPKFCMILPWSQPYVGGSSLEVLYPKGPSPSTTTIPNYPVNTYPKQTLTNFNLSPNHQNEILSRVHPWTPTSFSIRNSDNSQEILHFSGIIPRDCASRSKVKTGFSQLSPRNLRGPNPTTNGTPLHRK